MTSDLLSQVGRRAVHGCCCVISSGGRSLRQPISASCADTGHRCQGNTIPGTCVRRVIRADTMAKTHRWCFTLNNYSEFELNELKELLIKNATYAIIGEEIGENGTPHLQGYANLGRLHRKTLNIMRKEYSVKAHWEQAKGTDVQNKEYCSKENHFWEHGSPQTAGKRNDLESAIDTLKSTKDMHMVAIEHSSTFVRYHRGLTALSVELFRQPPRDYKTKVVVLTGPPGTGKTRLAHEYANKHHSGSIFAKTRGEWWDGYNNHEAVIIDDFYGWLKHDELLKITDRYPYQVPVKGAFRNFVARIIFITSNSTLPNWYKFDKFDPSALNRRMDIVYEDMVPSLDELEHSIDNLS